MRLPSRLLCSLPLLVAGCPLPADDGPVDVGPAIATWTFGGDVFVVDVGDGAIRNVSALLPRPGRSADRWLVPSPGGAFFALSADIGDRQGEILVRTTAAFDVVEPVMIGGSPVYLEGLPAITDAGDVVVFAAGGGPHSLDLWKSTRADDGTWGAPVLLTASSSRPFNNQPSLSRDGTRVFFNCGAERDPESGDTAACVVDLDGAVVDVVVAPDTLPDGRNSYVNFPRDGGDVVVFEGSWPQGDGEPPETLWQRRGDDDPTPAISRDFDNTVSPCVLADGSIIALWLGRPGGTGVHELTHLRADGSFTTLSADGVDVDDIGIGCTNR